MSKARRCGTSAGNSERIQILPTVSAFRERLAATFDLLFGDNFPSEPVRVCRRIRCGEEYRKNALVRDKIVQLQKDYGAACVSERFVGDSELSRRTKKQTFSNDSEPPINRSLRKCNKTEKNL
jgi:hypothetical protein